jgi:hypothetical protein
MTICYTIVTKLQNKLSWGLALYLYIYIFLNIYYND